MTEHTLETTTLGRTGLRVTRSAFGALPVQRLTVEEGARLMRRAYDAGIIFFDTARSYSDSEMKMGIAFEGVADNVIIATKTPARDPGGIRRDIGTSLGLLKRRYIDVYQFHNPPSVPAEDHPAYKEMLALKAEGLIRHIGITCHKLSNALEAARSGLYDTVQYPLSALSNDDEIAFIEEAGARNIGVIAMKAMCGGLLKSAAPSMAFLRRFPHVVPIWGIQRDSELDEVIMLEKAPPALDDAMLRYIEDERAALASDFCRGCGYCLPCPADIPINNAARMPLLLRRAPVAAWLNDEWDARMARITQCQNCGACLKRCPYGLNPPELLKKAYDDYFQMRVEHAAGRA